MRDWWERTTSRLDDDRPFNQLPLALVLLRLYRYAAAKKKEIESKPKRTFEDTEAIDRWWAMIKPEKPKAVFEIIEGAIAHKETADPVWDKWVRELSMMGTVKREAKDGE